MKKLCVFLVAIILAFSMAGCNRQVLDLTYKYDQAVIGLPDGTIVTGEVESWRDYEDGDQIQVKINGVTYLVHSTDVVLIAG